MAYGTETRGQCNSDGNSEHIISDNGSFSSKSGDEEVTSKSQRGPAKRELYTSLERDAHNPSLNSEQLQKAPTLISQRAIECLKSLTRLFADESLQGRHDVAPALWQDELGRLRVWAANIGAHQTGTSSLDYRLRDASHIKDQTLLLLGRLQRLAQDIEDDIHGSEYEASGSEDDFLDEGKENEDGNGNTELQSIYHALVDTINNLFQMSILIRRPAQQDRLLGTKRSDAAPFEPFDRQHVENKYPNADRAIINRLGSAISRRRAVLRYRERHHLKLIQGFGQAVGGLQDTVSTKFSDTVATEFVEMPESYIDFESHTVVSQTSYAPTILHGEEA
ncbi:Zinc finger C2H2 [Penicillium cosmopolitanum]|uniref:Zinc finger C2H2 n=1 Tax=Penicillium cosmopolitanum TaxID=1131564 RepID=A0A9X0BC92_9EURO|nr:Zinc finger C2H2 [Penicillium cosmopolitanum]KAJ5404486.1 Zinc finger C2H2 [Penicillium cosmopolitanum]